MSARQLAIGIGFRHQCAAYELMALIESALQRSQLLGADVSWIASHHTKRDDPLLAEAAQRFGCQRITFDSQQLAAQDGVTRPSHAVEQRLGTASVAEAAALAALHEAGYRSARLVLAKQRSANATLAIAEA
ncbi:cobalamin biosynthesis protein [Carnimonas sp. R-84981]|uniref:cobalamin biosynthesis protein n=1 Tax=Carnimonas bestiolae TaxID=3402172 RepID=UPI003EDC1C4E